MAERADAQRANVQRESKNEAAISGRSSLLSSSFSAPAPPAPRQWDLTTRPRVPGRRGCGNAVENEGKRQGGSVAATGRLVSSSAPPSLPTPAGSLGDWRSTCVCVCVCVYVCAAAVGELCGSLGKRKRGRARATQRVRGGGALCESSPSIPLSFLLSPHSLSPAWLSPLQTHRHPPPPSAPSPTTRAAAGPCFTCGGADRVSIYFAAGRLRFGRGPRGVCRCPGTAWTQRPPPLLLQCNPSTTEAQTTAQR